MITRSSATRNQHAILDDVQTNGMAKGSQFLQIIAHLPSRMVTHCFAQRDLDRLRLHGHEIVLTPSDDPEALARTWRENAASADLVLTGWDSPPLTDAMLDLAPGLRAIVHAAGSVKSFIPGSIWRRGIRLASCSDALGVGVAETTLGMIICGLKGFVPSAEVTRRGGWQNEFLSLPGFQPRELFDVTIGIIGASRVGRHLIRLLKPFEARVLVTDPHLDREEAASLGVECVDLDQLVAQSDVVSLHAPALESTRRMLGAKHFQAMKDGAIFINTARGMIVDEEAMTAELSTGRIWAFLDVTNPEPPPARHPLRLLPNVILTPHIAGALTNGSRRMGRSAVEQILEFARGEVMDGEITADRLAQLA
jgi:phosphoglycerate dehydrogenase-like enzyme